MGDDGSSRSAPKWIKHYSDFHKILLVGEGDFSFALSLATAFASASNIVATSLDSQVEVIAKYSKAESNLKELKEMGCTIIHQLDVHTMRSHPLLLHSTFDKIVFNFPHASLIWREHDLLQIGLHQELVRVL
ncbi:hypothetical protein M5689_013659 [Euphorbia peplus]|nr:hypothetical protein M5689_013659 [Euphorbia peplus]